MGPIEVPEIVSGDSDSIIHYHGLEPVNPRSIGNG